MLRRELSFLQATAINMIDMVGIGPFVTTALVASTMGSSEGALLAWLCGMVIALIDASVWSELGAAMPKAGGSYAFLREAFGAATLGRLMSFLFVWQTTFQAPLVIASGALGFATYAAFVTEPLRPLESRAIAVGVILLLMILLYRRVKAIGAISVVLWTCVIATMGWIILSGIVSPTAAPLQTTSGIADGIAWNMLGAALLPTVYSYLGYYNVCHLGAEVRNPERVIPRSMYVSIIGIGAMYLSMQWAITHVLDAETIARSPFVVSEMLSHVWGYNAGYIGTILILIVAIASLFSVMLGYTRIPYAAAQDGLFFRVFAKEHPTGNFPHVSLLILGSVSMVFAATLTLGDSIKAIITMRVFTQFIAQAAGLMVLRRRVGAANMPWRMWLYPLPVIATIAIWLWLFASADSTRQLVGVVAPVVGALVYLVLARRDGQWPFQSKEYSHDAH